jgi:hypothetical protein
VRERKLLVGGEQIDAVVIVCPKCQQRRASSGVVARVVEWTPEGHVAQYGFVTYADAIKRSLRGDGELTTWNEPFSATAPRELIVQCRHGARPVSRTDLLAELCRFQSTRKNRVLRAEPVLCCATCSFAD